MEPDVKWAPAAVVVLAGEWTEAPTAGRVRGR